MQAFSYDSGGAARGRPRRGRPTSSLTPEAARFRETTRLLSTTPADAMRIFVSAFNAHRGFPFDVRLPESKAEAFASEEEASEFSVRLALRMMSDAR